MSEKVKILARLFIARAFLADKDTVYNSKFYVFMKEEEKYCLNKLNVAEDKT